MLLNLFKIIVYQNLTKPERYKEYIILQNKNKTDNSNSY